MIIIIVSDNKHLPAPHYVAGTVLASWYVLTHLVYTTVLLAYYHNYLSILQMRKQSLQEDKSIV